MPTIGQLSLQSILLEHIYLYEIFPERGLEYPIFDNEIHNKNQ